MEPNKIIIVGWVDHTLLQSFTKKSKFKTIGIWPFNPTNAMDGKTQPSKIYTITNMNMV